jgi:hypothetical protein
MLSPPLLLLLLQLMLVERLFAEHMRLPLINYSHARIKLTACTAVD